MSVAPYRAEGWPLVDSARPVIYLARHATPDWSRTDIPYDIPPGPPLTEQGEAEARLLGEFLQDAQARHVFASPLERTQRTAQLGGEPLGLTHTTDHAIAEYRRDENDAGVFTRLMPAMEQAWALAKAEGPVVFVTHGGCVRVLLEKLGVLPDAIMHYRRQFDHQNPAPPAGVWAFTRDAEETAWQAELVFSPTALKPWRAEVVHV